MAIAINFAAININAMNRDAAVAIGENNQPGWTAHNKANFGLGLQFGISFTANQFNVIADNDVIDAPINDQDGIPGNQNQTL
ncbi:hypothetical protein [Tuberibacillus calidus]|uniref:hypothetical protein n=1 Tax=Tuberibacillus calidus TaxID=340097 RepID=UPI0003FC613A|nr:hypothetical protein [Tuberibacillus calidus]